MATREARLESAAAVYPLDRVGNAIGTGLSAATAGVILGTLRPARDGWIGNWSPGIGDPPVVGWMTVLLYFAAVGLCGWVLRTKGREMAALERWVWRGLAAGLDRVLTRPTVFGRRPPRCQPQPCRAGTPAS